MSSTTTPTKRPKQRRYAITLSLRMDHDFEEKLGLALKSLPYGYAKTFTVRVARLFGRETRTVAELVELMRHFVDDVQPVCLGAMPEVRLPFLRRAIEGVDEAARQCAEAVADSPVAEQSIEEMRAMHGLGPRGASPAQATLPLPLESGAQAQQHVSDPGCA